MLERGDYSGAKNVTGGRLYVSPIRDLYPELWEEAPFERPVARELVTMADGGAATTVEIASERFLGAQPQSYTVLRARLDQWLAEKVMEKGAMVVPNMKVDELLRKDGRVIGIRAGDDEIGADVVIVAEGVLRLLAARPAWRPSPGPSDHALGYKEVIELPAGVIEDRWHLNQGEGAAQLFVGAVTRACWAAASSTPTRRASRWASWSAWTRCSSGRSPRWSRGGCWTSSRSCRRSGRWSPAAPWSSTRRTPSPRAASARCRAWPATATSWPATPRASA